MKQDGLHIQHSRGQVQCQIGMHRVVGNGARRATHTTFQGTCSVSHMYAQSRRQWGKIVDSYYFPNFFLKINNKKENCFLYFLIDVGIILHHKSVK